MVRMQDRNEVQSTNFNAIRISVASPEQILNWSHGEVTKPETINYRTLRPEKDGLFCERLFGPTKDWECFCGKYKRLRYRGVICDRCGVEVTRSKVRRERMGHIRLAAPVAHIWFSKTTPSRLSLLLDLSPRNLERVLYFAQHIIISVDDEKRREIIEEEQLRTEIEKERILESSSGTIAELREELEKLRVRLNELRNSPAPVSAEEPEISSETVNLSDLPDHLVGHYLILDVPLGASDRDITQAYRTLILKWHPDRNNSPDAEERTKKLNGAREVLRDPELRKEYDTAIESEIERIIKVREQAPVVETALATEKDAEIYALEAEYEAVETRLSSIISEELDKLDLKLQETINELEDLKPLKILAESKYRELKDRFADVFQAGMGAEAILEILKTRDLEAIRDGLVKEMRSTSGQRRKKAIKRLQVVEAFRSSGNRVEDIILTVLPVLPPELRPMVQLDGGRFATSDLNDLYRRVINRNNRLKRLMDLMAPDIIIRNEKRMLQESVDALIDNGRRGRPIQGSHNHKLKSLSDLLRGKQGRFRQNLLGKRVDYSGRSVIVVGPELKMHQCGLPKRMALELFKPFVMHRLVKLGVSPNIKSAKRLVERTRPEVWDILEEVIKDRPVLLNRAPTLHRLGIQAFMPVLIEGHAIQLHPLVCSAFNADFDGDQMAVHVPLSRMAVHEASQGMLSTHNMLSPASGEPLVAPTLDMVLGCYYLTEMQPGARGEGLRFYDIDEARIAAAAGHIELRARIYVRRVPRSGCGEDSWVETTLGRLIFNEILPDRIDFKNYVLDSKAIKGLTAELYRELSNDETAEVLDRIKDLGFEYATRSGITVAISDLQVPTEKIARLREAEEKISGYRDNFEFGLMDDDERYMAVVEAWTQASEEIEGLVSDDLENYGGIGVMAQSGTKGNIMQIKQMSGMRGLMSKPTTDLSRQIIELPIRSSFREGLTGLEYFISTHGARKGLTDTALNTASSGYLTRRLVDVAQDVIIREEDCGTYDFYTIGSSPETNSTSRLVERIVGRLAGAPIISADGEIVVDHNEVIDEAIAEKIINAGVDQVPVRSPLTCEARRGVCQMCYGHLPATRDLVELGQAVGIIAAQSIGEPGTQLTMRTFHTGGQVSRVSRTSTGQVRASGITSIVRRQEVRTGLPRVEELFEARVPFVHALLTEIDGEVEIIDDEYGLYVRVISREEYREAYPLPEGVQIMVSDGDAVEAGMLLAATLPSLGYEEEAGAETESQPAPEVVSLVDGRVEIESDNISVVWEEVEERLYPVRDEDNQPDYGRLRVNTGDVVRAGDPLTNEDYKSPVDILNIQGTDELKRYLVDEVQKVYKSQGVDIHDKHIEIILRQMLRRVQVKSIGDSDFIPDQVVDKIQFQGNCAKVLAEGGEPPTAAPILLGVTRASLRTDSFLAAASFQETTRVLTQAAVSGQHDYLQGLKENVIIGRLIPAQVASTGLTEEPESTPLPNFQEMGEIEELVTTGWLEAPNAPTGTQMAFGNGETDLATSGFYVDSELRSDGGSSEEEIAAGLPDGSEDNSEGLSDLGDHNDFDYYERVLDGEL